MRDLDQIIDAIILYILTPAAVFAFVALWVVL